MSSTLPIVNVEEPSAPVDATVPTATTAPATPKKRIVLALAGREFSSEFMLSLIRTLYVLWESGNAYEVILSPGYSSHVALARLRTLGCDNLRGADQKAFNGMPYDTIVFIDSDIVWNPEQFLALLQSAEIHPVVTGLYRMADLVHFASVKTWDEAFFCKNGTFEFLTADAVKEWKETTKQRYMQVSYAGMGFMALSKSVMDSLSYPFFDAPVQEIITPEGKILRDICSEDVAFCKNIQKAGYDVYIDTDIVVGHQKPLII